MVTPIQQQCVQEIHQIDALLDLKVRGDVLGKIGLYMAYLILYILANMMGDKDGMETIDRLMSQLLHSIGEETQIGRFLKEVFQSIQQDPSAMNQDMLDWLQKVEKMLQHS